jgi:hypothetical protein
MQPDSADQRLGRAFRMPGGTKLPAFQAIEGGI